MGAAEKTAVGETLPKGGAKGGDVVEAPPPPKEGPPPVSYFGLFRFADSTDVAMLGVGYTSALVGGVITPLSAVALGELFNAVSNPGTFDAAVNRLSGYLGLIALGAFGLNFIGVTLASFSAERQARRARVAYMRGILRQDQAWYDQARFGEASSRLSSDTLNFQAGLGDKVCLMLNGVGQFVCGFVVSFAVSPDSWKLALVLLAFVPAVAAVFGVLFSLIKDLEGGTDDAYARAGDVASEALALIRTVASFGGEAAEFKRYDKHLSTAEKAGYKKGWLGGFNAGIFWVVLMVFYGVGLYAGARFIILNREAHPGCVFDPTQDVCFGGGEVVQSLFALISGAAALGFVFPNAKYVAGAQAAAASLYAIIDRTPPIDPFSTSGHIPLPGIFKGRIEFKNVTFAYPTRMDVKVLCNFTLTIEPGETVALVGASGSGKSTIVGLILRWYDVLEGQVCVDGVDVKEYNVSWLRAQMGLVSQEPQLLPGTIEQNIMFGKPVNVPTAASLGDKGGPAKSPRTPVSVEVEPSVVVDKAAVVAAARAANAHDFIVSLPDGYETSITGMQLSGGQKQRVAIARAIIRDPQVLLLDEATSALDTASERIVQASIDAIVMQKGGVAGSGRTSVVIAHRLSTVVKADRIVVLDAGRVIEEGTHGELLARGTEAGTYARLWDLQRLGSGTAGKGDTGVAAVLAAPHKALPLPVAAAAISEVVLPAAVSHTEAAAVTFENPMHVAKEGGSTAAAAAEKRKDRAVAGKSARKVMDWSRLWGFQKPEAAWVVFGLFMSLASGCLLPGFSLVLANVFDLYYDPSSEVVERKAREYLYIFLGIGAAAMLITVAQGYSFGVFGERLIHRLRAAAFKAVLKQHISFYDMPDNAVGALTTRLGNDASQLRLVLGARLGDKVSAVATAIMGLVIAFTSSWELSLIVLAITPLFLAAIAMENKVNFAGLEIAKEAYSKAGVVATDATSAMRVVASFGLQHMFVDKFVDLLRAPYEAGKKRAVAGGLGVGSSNGFQVGIPALVFWVGAQLVKEGRISFGDVIKVFFAFQFSTIGLQNIGTLAQDLAQLASAFTGLVALIDAPSSVDATVTEGGGHTPPPGTPVTGAITFHDVHFRYPARPDQPVLRGLNLVIRPGTTVAIVGPSGSGKSTVIQLLQRFYDPEAGSVTLDGRDLREYHPSWLRSHIGWVQQEAPLWADSLDYNVGYGRTGTKPEPEQGMPRDAKQGAPLPSSFFIGEGVEKAAADANAATFIEGFPWGYATFVGVGGLQLSGGQKQRVAIARAVIRAPPILLLDEATSALDSESEAVVQASIDRLLQEGRSDGGVGKRTTLVIAHRLSTVRGADSIVVVDGGVVVEQGSHAELMAKQEGLYRKLALAQDPHAA